MPKSLFKFSLLFAVLLLSHPATAAKFAVKDLSGEQRCMSSAWWQALQPEFSAVPQCTSYPAGTVSVSITPEAGELPAKCYDNGNFCMYAANFYIAAHYQGQWFAKIGNTWTPVDISQLQPRTTWPPWSGTGSMWYEIESGELNLNTGRIDPPPEGFEVYVGIIPAGSSEFLPSLVARVYPVPNP